jgi:hypothetical protein
MNMENLYQGTEGWNKGLVLEDLIDLEGIDPELHQWVPKFAVDLIRLDTDSPRIHPHDQMARLGLGLMQAVMNHQVAKWLEENIKELDEAFGPHHDQVTLILYYSLFSGADLTDEQFQNILKDTMMTSREVLPNS